jgi:hypothetical protein
MTVIVAVAAIVLAGVMAGAAEQPPTTTEVR